MRQAARATSPEASSGAAESFSLKGAPGKGLGAFATRGIAAGELVISEAPLLRVERPFLEDSIRKAAESLHGQAHEDFWSLFDKAAQKTPEGIFSCNYFEMDGDGGVYKTICRFNHSCLPNCVHAFRADTEVGELRALRCVPEGEELMVAYIELCAPRHTRQAQLERGFGFTCCCEACARADPESDRRRTMLCELDGRIGEAAEAIHASDGAAGGDGLVAEAVAARAEGLRLAVEVLRLVAEEGLASAAEVDARTCATAVLLLAGHPEHQASWAEKCLARYSLGASSEDAGALRRQLEEIMAAPARLPPISPSLLGALTVAEALL